MKKNVKKYGRTEGRNKLEKGPPSQSWNPDLFGEGVVAPTRWW